MVLNPWKARAEVIFFMYRIAGAVTETPGSRNAG